MISKYFIVVLSILFTACTSSGYPASAAKTRSEASTQSSPSVNGHSQGVKAAVSPTSTNTPTDTTSSKNTEKTAASVVISGGFDTDPQDKGRPVVLIAAALGVPTEVFRAAFRGVTPAGAGSEPSPAQAQRNKAALLKVLAPYKVTNERLDEVSNYYRYNKSKGEIWQRTQAEATATITNGVVTDITITNPGSGYSSNPTVTVIGPTEKVIAKAALSYSKDFKSNGSVSAITIK